MISDVRQVESHIPHEFGYDASEIPGSRALLTSVASAGNDCRKDDTSHSKISSNIPWAIVTSGTAPLVNAWLDVMKIEAHPPHLISAETVAHGKPNPEGYLLALRKLGLHKPSSSPSPSRDKVDKVEQSKSKDSISEEEKGDKSGNEYKSYDTKDILVLEDSPAGVRAGKAAGCRVVALLTTHEQSALEEAGADWIVKDMRSVVFRGWKDAIANNNGEVEKGGIVSIAIVNNLRSSHCERPVVTRESFSLA